MIYLGSDHGGFQLKEKIRQWLKEWKFEYQDLGAHSLDPEDDYPRFAFAVAEKVASVNNSKGILTCRSAAGVVIAANKVKNVRAVAVYDTKGAKHSREHNDANVIALSGDWSTDDEVKGILKVWLNTKFSNEPRHKRRIEQIGEYEMIGK